MENCQLSIVMPCLNEAETLAVCIRKAQAGLAEAGVTGEVLIADNGSTDGSIAIAEQNGARVVHVTAKGYGNALRGGIEAARGQWVIMGDADDSYDFSKISGFVEKLKAGADLVMGCRLPSGGGTIMSGAMPWKNRWIGNPSLSFIGRLCFKTPIKDFHCGLRGFSKAAYDRMDLKTTGMEFASEMVMKATLQKMNVDEVAITLHKDGRSRPPHLKPWRDGWRHLRFMLIYSPRWLFLVPGLVIAGVGALAALLIYFRLLPAGAVNLDTGAFAVACGAVIAGVTLVGFACLTKVFAIGEGLLPEDPKFASVFRHFTLEKGLLVGLGALLLGGGMLAWAVWVWGAADFGNLPYADNMRRVIASTTFLLLGVQIMAVSLFMSVLGLRTTTRHPPTP